MKCSAVASDSADCVSMSGGGGRRKEREDSENKKRAEGEK